MSNGSLKVLWVSPTLGQHFGGPTSTMVNGLIAERRGGIDVELATTEAVEGAGHREAPVQRLEADGVKVRLFPRAGLTARDEAWGFSPRLILWMIRNLRKYDVVHLQYVWCVTSIVGVVAGRLAGVPVVLTPHESLTDFDVEVASRHPLLRLFKRILRPLFFRATDQLVFMSRLEERDTPSGAVPSRIVTHAVLEEPVPANESHPRSKHLRVAFLGRNVPKKGIHLIFEAIAARPDRERTITVAGPPGPDEYRVELGELAQRLGIEDRIEWAGYVDDRGSYLREADVLAMPSEYEGFGMVAAEAMCAGTPVVVPALSGVAEIVSEFDAGIVMPVSSAQALDEAFSRLEDDQELAGRLGANGIRAANSALTFAAFAAQTSEIYDGVSRRSSGF